MGICASCLGLDCRAPASHQGDLDRILDSDQRSYGAIDARAWAQPDEEELLRERDALEHITSLAADHMIDVLHPSHSDRDHSLAVANSHKLLDQTTRDRHPAADNDREEPDAEEAAWLESIQAAGLDTVRMPQQGNLVMDISLLRAGAQ